MGPIYAGQLRWLYEQLNQSAADIAKLMQNIRSASAAEINATRRKSAKAPSIEEGHYDIALDMRGKLKAPTAAAARKALPVTTGVLDYFPRAILAIAELSRIGNEQHNPGEPLHWDKTKSTDHADCITRHLIDRGTIDTDSVRHSTKVAWRALALLETELEAAEGPA